MFPYILYIALLVIAAFSEQRTPQSRHRLWVIFIFLSFVILAGFTNGNGLDWYGNEVSDGYALIDYKSLNYSELSNFEPGFVFVNKVLGNFHLFLIVMCVACFYMVWHTIKWGSKYKLLALFVYLSSMTLYCYMGVYRHAIAQTIIICSWPYMNNKKKFALFIFAACLFHYAAAIAFLYFLIPKNRVIRLGYYGIIGLVAFCARSYVLPILMVLAVFFPGQTAGKLALYLNADDFGSEFSIPLLLSKIIIFLFAYYYIDRRDEKQCFLTNAYAVSILLFIVVTFSPTFARLSLFFSCTEIILLPITLENIFKKSSKNMNHGNMMPLIYLLLIIVIYTYSYFRILIPYRDIYIPYHSLLF